MAQNLSPGLAQPLLAGGSGSPVKSMPQPSGGSEKDIDRLLLGGAPAAEPAAGGFRMPGGTLVLRAADGISRNILFANQIDVLQRFAGLGQNSAQQQAKFLSALCSSTPLAIGFLMRQGRLPLHLVVLAGCSLQLLGLVTLAAAAAGLVGRDALLVGLFVFYACGYGALVAALPVLGLQEVPVNQRPAFSQHFFACLSAGSFVGICFSAGAQLNDVYPEAFVSAAIVLASGTAAFVWRRPEPGCGLVQDGCDEASSDGDAVGGSTTSTTSVVRSLRFLLALVPFYAAYLQWTTSWYLQAQSMDRIVLGFELPACLLQAVERVAALFFNLVLGRVLRDHGGEAPLEGRLAVGCLLAALALVTSGLVEDARRGAPRLLGDGAGISSMSVIWLVPQYCLIAAAESAIFPAQSEWAAGRPDLYGLAVLMQAAAAFGLGLLLPHLSFWLPQSSINDGRYDLYFFSLAVGCTVSAAVLSRASGWGQRPDTNASGGSGRTTSSRL